jgi:predicted RNase H-like nuclease
MTACAGIDGCKGGWIAVWRNVDSAPQRLIKAGLSEILSELPPETLIAIDMPIGLPDRVGTGGRGAEQAARQMLAKRRSSIFTIASRTAVYAGDEMDLRQDAYQRTNEIALETSDPPRKISIQAFGIFPKIREVDQILRASPSLSQRIFEAHPELAFRALNGGAEMQRPKSTADGLVERRTVLASAGLSKDFLEVKPSKDAKTDDFLDACALLLVAGRIAKGEAVSYPDPPGRDAFGLPIAIWA